MIVLFSVESVDSEMANETDFSLNDPSILRTGCPDLVVVVFLFDDIFFPLVRLIICNQKLLFHL